MCLAAGCLLRTFADILGYRRAFIELVMREEWHTQVDRGKEGGVEIRDSEMIGDL